jgi:hypothetical protein
MAAAKAWEVPSRQALAGLAAVVELTTTDSMDSAVDTLGQMETSTASIGTVHTGVPQSAQMAEAISCNAS